MSVKEFWNDEPELLWTYRKSYMDKLKIQKDLTNYKAWLHGLYVFDAVSTSLYNCFGKKETQPNRSYAEKPYDFNKKMKTKEEIEKERILRVEEQIKEQNKKIKEILNKKKKVKNKG